MGLKIVGAGMAGLLAARMLANRNPVVYERQKSLPHNHSAVLRFRSDIVGRVLGIRFRRVRVVKTSVPWKNPAADALSYSYKATGTYRTDRSLPLEPELVDRWIAPPDLIERMSAGVSTCYGREFPFSNETEKVISTIPMHHLMMELGYKSSVRFEYVKGCNVRATVDSCDAHATVYFPSPHIPMTRASLTGSELICELSRYYGEAGLSEGAALRVVETALRHLGITSSGVSDVQIRHQEYQKIQPIDDEARRRFIFWASTVQGRAFSLGRYATWRPGLLADDLVQDVRKIEGMIDDPYLATIGERR